jgi:hypothetical protein
MMSKRRCVEGMNECRGKEQSNCDYEISLISGISIVLEFQRLSNPGQSSEVMATIVE